MVSFFRFYPLNAEKHFMTSKGPVIRATFFFNLSCNIVAVQVETLCCAYYHLRVQLVPQQNILLQISGILRIWLVSRVQTKMAAAQLFLYQKKALAALCLGLLHCEDEERPRKRNQKVYMRVYSCVFVINYSLSKRKPLQPDLKLASVNFDRMHCMEKFYAYPAERI